MSQLFKIWILSTNNRYCKGYDRVRNVDASKYRTYSPPDPICKHVSEYEHVNGKQDGRTAVTGVD
jgi:hypothetical protein